MFLLRRFLAPLALIALSTVALLLVLDSALPRSVHRASAGTAASRGLLPAASFALQLLAWVGGALLALAAVLLGARWRARRRRARADDVVCAELCLGRDEQASPYELSKLFDGLAGALRPAPLRRALNGAPTIGLRISSRGGADPVRFFVKAPSAFQATIAARLRATYPEVRLTASAAADADPFALAEAQSPVQALRARLRREPAAPLGIELLRIGKAKRWLWALASTKDYEHSLVEALVSVMHAQRSPCQVELFLTPAPVALERYAAHALRGRERRLLAERAAGASEPGVQSVVAKKQLQGAVEGVGRAWWWFDLYVIVARGELAGARQLAGVLQESRDNYLRARRPRARRRLYAWRLARGLAPCVPGLWCGALSSAELPALWQLPSLRLKGAPLHRAGAREIAASAAVNRDPASAVMRDERGPVGIDPADRRYGWMLLGAPGSGKTAALAPHVRALAEDGDRALVLIDPKEDFARLALGLIPARRTVHYLDLAAPRYGLNVLTAARLSPEVRADIFIAALRELGGEQAVGPRSDVFLRAALEAVMLVEPLPALQHVAALLDPYDAGYRECVVRELRFQHEVDFLRDYWQRSLPAMLRHNQRFLGEALAAPTNKIARFLVSPSLNLLMTHPRQLQIERILRRREILIVNASKGAIGESNANLFCSMLVLLVQRALHQMQRLAPGERVQAALVIDEAHNVLIPAFAKLLAEGRSGGLEVAAAFQYTAQIADQSVRAGVRSLLQNVSIFRQRDMEEARAAAALAMEVFQDSIGGELSEQRRLRLDPIDILAQPNYRAVNLWLAHGVPQPAATASTEPMERLVQSDQARAARAHHEREQRRRGSHPHDDGRYIQPPLVRSARTPIVARFRTVHVDLGAWPQCPAPSTIARVAVTLQAKGGEPLAFVAVAADCTARRYLIELSGEREAPGWLAPGGYLVEVLVWVAGEGEPLGWQPRGEDGEPSSVELREEPRRPARSAGAAR